MNLRIELFYLKYVLFQDFSKKITLNQQKYLNVQQFTCKTFFSHVSHQMFATKARQITTSKKLSKIFLSVQQFCVLLDKNSITSKILTCTAMQLAGNCQVLLGFLRSLISMCRSHEKQGGYVDCGRLLLPCMLCLTDWAPPNIPQWVKTISKSHLNVYH